MWVGFRLVCLVLLCIVVSLVVGGLLLWFGLLLNLLGVCVVDGLL